MDEWIPETECIPIVEKRKRGRPKKRATTEAPTQNQVASAALISRGRSVALPITNGKPGVKEVEMTEEEFDLLQHKLPDKNFDQVQFGPWAVKPWCVFLLYVEVDNGNLFLPPPRYFSPYPLTDFEVDDLEGTPSTPQSQSMRIPGVSRTAGRSHGRTLDHLMGKLEKARANERTILFVCEMCFKYMTDHHTYDQHIVRPHVLSSLSLLTRL